MNVPKQIVGDQAKGLRRINHPKPVKTIAVTGGKGGVGKTNAAVNMALALAASGNKVMLLDADFGLANVDVQLGLSPEYDLSHLIAGERNLEEIVVDGPRGIKIIPASSGISRMAELTQLEHAGVIRAFSELSYDVDYLIVDTAAGISNAVVSFCRASHEVVLVVCDEPASITDAYALIKVLSREHGVNHFHVLANMACSVREGNELYNKLAVAADHFLDATLSFLGVIPTDDRLKKAVRLQRAVVDLYPGSPSAMAFKKIAGEMEKWPDAHSAGGQLEFFVERLIDSERELTGVRP
ncbi:MAG TPA: MinD/ParA family protein [Chromatiaceae bacterium]|nr:MinD/ParA family protein [Chromatiaceae bacterium]